MRDSPRNVLRCLLVASVLTLTCAALVPATASGDQAATAGQRVKDAPRSAVRQSVTQEGGVKATMTGGNTVYADVREDAPRADGYRHIDTPALVGRLKAEGLNTYIFGIWDSPTDWDDLRTEFAPAAEAAGINIWVYIVPPSECLDSPIPHESGRCSRPYKLDFISWASEIATLSQQHSNIVAWAIDDFLIGDNSKLFTPEYMQRIVERQDAINPLLGFYTTAYYDDAVSPEFYQRFAPYIDGIVYPYLGTSNNTQDSTAVQANLDRVLEQTQPRNLDVLFLAYANRFLDAALPPTEDYVAQTIGAAMPYMRDGRILGINAYGLPLGDKPTITANNRAAHGIGRFNVSLASNADTQQGEYAGAEQRVLVDPLAEKYSLSFLDFDGYSDNLARSGQHIKQVLVDDAVVWESDVADPGGHTYQQRTVDLTEALRGKVSAKLTLRVFDTSSVADFPLDVGFDDLRADGFLIRNGGFESGHGWRMTANNSSLLPSIDRYAADRPARIREAVATTMRGLPYVNRPFTPEPPTSGYRSDNRAMFGNGRLSFAVPEKTLTTAGSCASASQVVQVDPSSARYEISFWDYDQYANTPAVEGKHIKRLLIDGNEVYHRDVVDPWENTWMNGDSAQGPIDITDFMRGKDSATVSFQLCEQSPVTDLDIDVGVDNVEAVGFNLRNPGFEATDGWELASTDLALTPSIKIAS